MKNLNSLRELESTCCLVTGASGYIGGALVNELVAVGAHVRRVSRAPLPTFDTKPSAVEDLQGDYDDDDMWARAVDGVDVVFHLAGMTSVYEAERKPHASLQANVGIVLRLLNACAARDPAPMVVMAGTVTAVGLPKQLPVDESVPDRPVTLYDLHKLTAERHLELFSTCGRVPATTLRLSNVYGPGGPVSAADRGVLNQQIVKGLNGETITIYGNGSQIRDYLFIDDVVRAFVMAAAASDRTRGRHFVLGSGHGYTLAESFNLVADRIALATGRRPPVECVPWPEGASAIEFRDFVADTKAFCRATGWKAEAGLADGIDATIAALSGIPAPTKSWDHRMKSRSSGNHQ